jgi:hypothetical protein
VPALIPLIFRFSTGAAFQTAVTVSFPFSSFAGLFARLGATSSKGVNGLGKLAAKKRFTIEPTSEALQALNDHHMSLLSDRDAVWHRFQSK